MSQSVDTLERKLSSLLDAGHAPDHEQVLDAALAAFLDFGLRRASMGDIAKRAGISPATLYRRFAQKDDVVAAVALREVQRLLALVDATLDRSAPVEDQLADIAVTILRTTRDHPLLRRVIETEPDFVLPLLTVHAGPTLELGQAYLQQLFARLQAEQRVPPFDAGPLSELLARLALSLVLTPQTSLPVADEHAFRALIREHVGPALRMRPAS